MRIRNAVITLLAVAGVAGAVALTVPAHAGDTPVNGPVIEIKDRGKDLTLGEIRQVVAEHVKRDLPIGKAIVVSDSGKPLSPEQRAILYSGKDAGDVKLLATVESPTEGTTIKELEALAGAELVSYRINLNQVPDQFIEIKTTRCGGHVCFHWINVSP